MATGAGTRTSTSQGSAPSDDWLACAKSAMSLVTSSLTEAPFGPALESIEDFRGELNAVEALLIAQRKRAGFSSTSTESILKKSGKVSKGEAKKRTKRSDAIDKNPNLAKKMSKGDISTEQVDLIAEASAKTDGDAAADPELIDEIAGANPDQGKGIIRDYIDNHQSQGDRDTHYAKQRRRRKAYKGPGTNGLSSIIIEGDDNSIDAALRNIRDEADRMYRQDGGRDVPNNEHPRTHNQRMFDAAMLFLTGSLTSNTPTDESAASKPTNRPSQRPVMVFRSDISGLTDDPKLLAEWTAELVGTGLVPSSLASYYRCVSDHVVQLVDGQGAVLWLGRTSRTVSRNQWIALVARDRSCVECGGHHTSCEAHHITPWTAPAKGETNIDELVLLCVDCHHRLHEANLTIEFDPHRRKWFKRPATWAETPAKGPPARKKPGRIPETYSAAVANSIADRSSEPSTSRPTATSDGPWAR